MEEFYKNHEGTFQLLGILIALLAAYFTIIQPILNFTRAQKKLNKDKRFDTYHNLIDHFAGANGTPKLDRQIAIIFELRRFPEYYPVTKRILSDWIVDSKNSSHPDINRLVTEMELTVNFIESSILQKKFFSQ